MAAVRHLEILLPPYETTREVSVADCSCLSNFMSIWYTDLMIQLFESFVYLVWKAYSGPQNGRFKGLWTPKCDYSSSRPQKDTSLCKSASFKLSTVKIRWGVWPVGELTESVTDTQTHTHTQVNLYSVHAVHSTGQTTNCIHVGSFINAGVDRYRLTDLVTSLV